MRVNRCVQFLAAVVSMTASVASASVLWQPVAVSTTMGEFSGTSFPIGNLISQTGLTIPYVSGVTDAATYSSTHNDVFDEWQSSGMVTGFVSFDLGSAQAVDGFRLWNSSWFTGGGSVAVNQFMLYADNDFDPLNGLGGILGTFNATQDGSSPHAMQSFGFASTMTQYVHMEILTNYGGSGSGFSEGAFTVPEPTTVFLVGLGLAGLGFARRRSPNA